MNTVQVGSEISRQTQVENGKIGIAKLTSIRSRRKIFSLQQVVGKDRF